MRAINLLLLAAIIGIELFAGIVVAPVLFYPAGLLGEGVLSLFESGLLMSQIFVRLGWILLVVAGVNFLFELFTLIAGRGEAGSRLRLSRLLLSLIILVLAGLFLFYFALGIVKLQDLGEAISGDERFATLHAASETVIKITVILQVVLFFLNFKITKRA